MRCPVCKSAMIVLELNEVEVDYCTSCGGVWLDAGELELLIDDEKGEENLLRSFTIDSMHQEKSYKCPICKKKMDKVYVGASKDVLIDKCPVEDGLWFDKGELEEVINLASGNNKVIEVIHDLFGNKVNRNQNGES